MRVPAHRCQCSQDRGQAVLLLLPVVAVAALVAVAVGHAGSQVHDRARAQAAADAAALAGVDGGRTAAAELAAANGAALTAFTATGAGEFTTVEVTVRVREAVASARATNGP